MWITVNEDLSMSEAEHTINDYLLEFKSKVDLRIGKTAPVGETAVKVPTIQYLYVL